MWKRPDFAALVLTHGRADRVLTVPALRKHGYSGRIVIVCDNEDKTLAEYRSRFPEVVVFDKAAVAAQVDEGDNFTDRRAILYARNAAFQVARDLGLRYFIELDDDYRRFMHRRAADGLTYLDAPIRDLDAVWTAMLEYFESCPRLHSVAMAQTGDYMGGEQGTGWLRPGRKAMNSFICDVQRPFEFFGRVNEDVNTYTNGGARGLLFLTTKHVALQQQVSQSRAGGMTELYLASGTYVKSFYSVMYQPSSVRIFMFPGPNPRLHHEVEWRDTVPVILEERWKKGTRSAQHGNGSNETRAR